MVSLLAEDCNRNGGVVHCGIYGRSDQSDDDRMPGFAAGVEIFQPTYWLPTASAQTATKCRDRWDVCMRLPQSVRTRQDWLKMVFFFWHWLDWIVGIGSNHWKFGMRRRVWIGDRQSLDPIYFDPTDVNKTEGVCYLVCLSYIDRLLYKWLNIIPQIMWT